MSKTDKTRPWWVKLHDPSSGAVMCHDHRFGECREATLASSKAGVVSRTKRWQHTRTCPRYEWVVVWCDPEDQSWGSCYRILGLFGEPTDSTPDCQGHQRLRLVSPEADCAICAEWDAEPTCWPSWPCRPYRWERAKIHGVTTLRASNRKTGRADRNRARQALRAAARDWNTYGDTDIEPDPFTVEQDW